MIKSLELPIGRGVTVLVDSSGTIYTCDKTRTRKNGRKDNRKGVLIKPTKDPYGYLRCTFSDNGERKSYYVHRLVAIAYIDNPLHKNTVNHINGIKTDNRVENLEWATNREQKEHAIRTGLAVKNMDALQQANRRRMVHILYNGKQYESIRAASIAENKAQATIRKYGEVI